MRIDFYCFSDDETDNYTSLLDYASNTLHICSSWINVLAAYLAKLIAAEDCEDEDEA